MTTSFIGPSNSQSSYLPPEQEFPDDDEHFREVLTQRERLTATILNVKENSQYEEEEILSGKQYFSTSVGGNVAKASYVYRLTFDLVALNGGVAIPIGVTTLSLQADPTVSNPTLINIPNSLIPVCGYGAATNSTNFIFINDPNLFIRTNIWTNVTQQIIITNTTGSALSQAWWVMEYVKL